MKTNIHYISGISGDRITITNDTLKKEYAFGYNCTYKRQNATEKAPYIKDLLTDIIKTNHINAEDIVYSGYNVFAKRELTKEEVTNYFNNILSEK